MVVPTHHLGRACETVFVVADALAHLFLHRPDGRGDLPGDGDHAERGAREGRGKFPFVAGLETASTTTADGTRHYGPSPEQYEDTVRTRADMRK